MVYRKAGVLLFALGIILSLSFISAAVSIKEEAVSVMTIKDVNMPAIYNLTITNLGEGDVFNIYSTALVSIQPNESFVIGQGETRTIQITALPLTRFKVSPDYYSFEYKVKGQKMGLQTDELSMTIVSLNDAFDFSIEELNPTSTVAVMHLKNKGGQNFDAISLEASSLLFNGKLDFSLKPFEDKKLEINLDKEKVKSLLAGQYVVNAKVTVNGVEAPLSTVLSFSEKEGIRTSESYDGGMIQVYSVEKKNEGNTKVDVTVIITKNVISGLFTSFNIDYDKREVNGLKVNYVFSNELAPSQSLTVTARTNWWILVLILIIAAIIWYCIDRYVKNKLVLTKWASFVRTKGGEFALRVTIKVKARDFVERIRVLDRIPPMVKVFERFGISVPEKIDPINRRLEWNIQALSKGEERELSYIIYSKIGVVGKFELPSVESIYEFQGNIKEARSNRVVYDNEPKREEENLD